MQCDAVRKTSGSISVPLHRIPRYLLVLKDERADIWMPVAIELAESNRDRRPRERKDSHRCRECHACAFHTPTSSQSRSKVPVSASRFPASQQFVKRSPVGHPSQTAILSPERQRPRLVSGRAGVQPIGFS